MFVIHKAAAAVSFISVPDEKHSFEGNVTEFSAFTQMQKGDEAHGSTGKGMGQQPGGPPVERIIGFAGDLLKGVS